MEYQLFLTLFDKTATICRMLTTRQKKIIITEHKTHETDTGSAEVQIGIVSKQIEELAEHLKKHAKDNHSRRGLLTMISKRRKLLNYLLINSPKSYNSLIKKLGLKK
jgi:small subunit ribosomal protein S15